MKPVHIVALVLGFVMMWLALDLIRVVAAHAQFAPMPLYEHPAKGQYDPYADHNLVPINCCSGRDCAPWPGDDIEPLPDGRYLIKSANGGRGAAVALNKIHPSFNGQYHLCKPLYNGNPKQVDVYADGTAVVYCLFVPQNM